MPMMCDQSVVYAQGKGEPVEDSGAAAEADAEDLRATAAGRWPFQRLCGHLLLNVLHAQWEVRPNTGPVCFARDPGCEKSSALPAWQEGGKSHEC